LRQRPVPPDFENISANHCKTAAGESFGVAPTPGPMGKKGVPTPDAYRIVNTGSSGVRCTKCSKTTTLKSNKCIHEEMQRLPHGALDNPAQLQCADSNCGSGRKQGAERANQNGSDFWSKTYTGKRELTANDAVVQEAKRLISTYGIGTNYRA
jgi:hypothetical protein